MICKLYQGAKFLGFGRRRDAKPDSATAPCSVALGLVQQYLICTRTTKNHDASQRQFCKFCDRQWVIQMDHDAFPGGGQAMLTLVCAHRLAVVNPPGASVFSSNSIATPKAASHVVCMTSTDGLDLFLVFSIPYHLTPGPSAFLEESCSVNEAKKT